MIRADRAKLVPECSYLLTGRFRADRVHTDYVVFDLAGGLLRVQATFAIFFDELRDHMQVALDR